jgi:DNA-binding winged helix-turn-helix (wHTH) protein
LGLAERGDPLEERVRRLVSYTGMGIGRRMLNRERGGSTALRSLGEDPLGDLLDVSPSETSGDMGDILRSGYLSLLYQRLPISPGESSLYFDLEPDSVLIIDRGDLEFVSRGFSQVLKGIARALEGGECTKEKLIQTVWGYRYDRLRHDSLIYQAVSRLRQLLGERGRWIEATEQGYRLNSQVRVRLYRRVDAERAELGRAENQVPEEAQMLETLNHRQLSILRRFRNHEFFDVQTCKALFKVSQITATRDLSGLHKLKLVNRVGKGRATRYYSTGG